MAEMTHDPIAAFFADAHRQWQHTFEQGGLGDKQELEMQWRKYLHDWKVGRLEGTHHARDGKSQTALRHRRSTGETVAS